MEVVGEGGLGTGLAKILICFPNLHHRILYLLIIKMGTQVDSNIFVSKFRSCVNQSLILRKLAHGVYRDCFQHKRKFLWKKMIFLYFCSKHTLWVHVRTALTRRVPTMYDLNKK